MSGHGTPIAERFTSTTCLRARAEREANNSSVAGAPTSGGSSAAGHLGGSPGSVAAATSGKTAHGRASSAAASVPHSLPPLKQHHSWSTASKHHSLTIKSTDDPFAVSGDDDWERMSDESVLGEDYNGRAPGDDGKSGLRRRPSILAGLGIKRRESTWSLSRSTSKPSSISSPRKSSQGVVAGESRSRFAPLRTASSLMSLRQVVQRDGSASGLSSPPIRRSTSLERPSLGSMGGSLGGSLADDATTASRAGSDRGSLRLFHSFRRRPTTPTRRSHGTSLELEFPTSEDLGIGDRQATISSKDGVEKIGVRTSVYTEDDRLAGLGLALTTDAPTRRVVPDNARLSIFSATTNNTADRSTLYSSIGSEYPSSLVRQRLGSTLSQGPKVYDVVEEEELYDPANEEIEMAEDPKSPTAIQSDAIMRTPPQLSTQSSANTLYSPSSPMARMSVHNGSTELARSYPHSRSTTLDSSTTSAAIQDHNQQMMGNCVPRQAPSTSPTVSPRPSESRQSGRAELGNDEGMRKETNPAPPTKSFSKSGSTTDKPGISKPLAIMYIVAGLPKDPATWSFTDFSDPGMPAPDHSPNAVPRFWRPEVLGCMTTNDESSPALDSLDCHPAPTNDRSSSRAGRDARASKPEFLALSKEEITKMQAKATKLAFTRDVEILASPTQPPATVAHFPFVVQTSAKLHSAPAFSGSTAAAWDSLLSARTLPSSSCETTYYASCLNVWSHADTVRSNAIRAALHSGSQAKNYAVNRAVKAARSGKKLGAKLAKQLKSPMGAVLTEGRDWTRAGNDTDTTELDLETDGFATESEWGDSAATASPLADLPVGLPLWLPYSLILVSHAPVYNILSDILRISWARYHQDIASHSLQMERILHFVAPRVGEQIRVPVSVATAKAQNTYFVATMPGTLDWKTGGSLDHNFIMFPIFKCLHADNLLTIAEIALSPLGRVLFVSAHPIMLSLATFTFQYILELRGWRGLVYPAVAARDIKIYLEDPGPWLMGVTSLCRSIALVDLPPEVVVVDLDFNAVNCDRPQPGSITSGPLRDKARKRLETAIGNVAGYYGVPSDLVEAFPAGRFRPFDKVEVSGVVRDAERIKPSDNWAWDQERVIQTFDAILAEQPRTGLGRFFNAKKPRKLAELDPSAKHVQAVVRRHAKTFVDRRDDLETKINKLNNKLASLMTESQEWQRSFDTFKSFSDKLTKESVDLKTRLEKERREARRLTGTLSVEKKRQADLEASLSATEKAREQALSELSNVQAIRDDLERQQRMLMTEMHLILATDSDSSPLVDTVFARIEALSSRSDASSRPGTAQSVRAHLNRRAGSTEGGASPLPPTEGEETTTECVKPSLSIDDVEDPEKMDAMRAAVQETLRSIQSRLQIVLRNAESIGQQSHDHRISIDSTLVSGGVVDLLDPRRGSTSTLGQATGEDETMTIDAQQEPVARPRPSPDRPLPATPVQASRTSIASTAESDTSFHTFRTARQPNSGISYREPRRFQPKPFSLTPSPTFSTSAEVRSTSPLSEHNRRFSDTRFVTDGNPRIHDHVANDSIMSIASFHDAREGYTTPEQPFPHGASSSRSKSSSNVDSEHTSHASQETLDLQSRNTFGLDDRELGSHRLSMSADDSFDNDDASFVSVYESLDGENHDSSVSARQTPEPPKRSSSRQIFIPVNSKGKAIETPPVELFTRARSPPARLAPTPIREW
ncbi:BQ2448_3768 [Microbotryum intermedium]|uniref:BQ2448_3768 protein n=1 Tax=Microbotryum intermedium TaxID=269621 RepID=A0A238FIV7_9BASI|nr:BQ2448_3768 [Microbotryum intermedium]